MLSTPAVLDVKNYQLHLSLQPLGVCPALGLASTMKTVTVTLRVSVPRRADGNTVNLK